MTESERDPDAEHFAAARDLAREAAAPPPGLPALSELQARFPEFELRGLIGRGGMGAVYRAHDPKLDRPVAIKILPAALGDDPNFAERFAQEARTLARLQHPHILTLHDYGERDGLPYLVTEFVDGVDLRRLMAGQRVDPVEALRIVPQICAALQFAHDHGVVHRDIKPENVLVDTDGHVKVADFGIARIVGGDGTALDLTATRHTIGTPHYTAPEALRGDPVDHRADLFALGVVFYELLTGHLPIGRYTPASKRAGTERRLDHIVERALSDEPAERYQSASEVRDHLERGAPVRRTPRAVSAGFAGAWPAFLLWSALGIALTVSLELFDAGLPVPAVSAAILALSLAAGVVISMHGFRDLAARSRRSDPQGLAVATCRAWLPPLVAVTLLVIQMTPPWRRGLVAAVLLPAAVAFLVWQIHSAKHGVRRRAMS